jgi:hypothetical protein
MRAAKTSAATPSAARVFHLSKVVASTGSGVFENPTTLRRVRPLGEKDLLKTEIGLAKTEIGQLHLWAT